MAQAEIGIFGGSGLYSLLEGAREETVETPYGAPSAPVTLGEIEGRRVAFMPRHGKHHDFPAHAVNYRANVYAMKSLGVTRIIGPGSCGSLQRDIEPGDFVVLDQFVDRTRARRDTYYDGPITTHVSPADPYCPEMRGTVIGVLDSLGFRFRPTGTQVIIQGPRFSTRAESKWFSSNGWHTVGMTQYPECMLAKELEICYTGIALVTDYDVGLEGEAGIEAVTADTVLKVFKENISRIQQLIFTLVPRIPAERGCACGSTLEHARFL